MTAHLIDGRAVAKRLNDEVPAELDGPCGLATVLVLRPLPPHIDEAVAPLARAVTPVPGGIGPVTDV